MMDETALLSSLIGDIYDAALDPGLWSRVLQGIARWVPGNEVRPRILAPQGFC
jgi:hypothetical protein